jgi:undecaprenyl-diphosphatase
MPLAGPAGLTTCSAAALLQWLTEWDLQIDQMARAWLSDGSTMLVLALSAISHLGDRWVIGSAALWACAAVALRGQPWRASVVAGLLAAQGLSIWVVKDWVARARPEGGAVAPAWVVVNGHSFPSGHAAAAALGFGLLAWLAVHSGPPHWRAHRRAIFATAVVLAVAVGVSRCLLGVHYAGDVLAGWCMGGAWLLMGLALLQRMPAR